MLDILEDYLNYKCEHFIVILKNTNTAESMEIQPVKKEMYK